MSFVSLVLKREELFKLVEMHGLGDPQVLRASQELDVLIVAAQKGGS